LDIEFDSSSEISHPSYHGVRWDERNREYLAFVKIPNSDEEIRLGFFQQAIMAAQAYDKNARDLLGPGVQLNFPDQFDPSCLIRRAIAKPNAPSTVGAPIYRNDSNLSISEFPPLGTSPPKKKKRKSAPDAKARMRAMPLRDQPRKLQKPKPNQGWADWRSEVILEQLERLSRQSDIQGLVDLNQLNMKLRDLHYRLGIDKETMVKVIKKKGICLRNCVQYGNNLEEILERNSRLRINPNDTKNFEYVRHCLVKIPNKSNGRLRNVIFPKYQNAYYNRR